MLAVRAESERGHCRRQCRRLPAAVRLLPSACGCRRTLLVAPTPLPANLLGPLSMACRASGHRAAATGACHATRAA